MRRKRILRTLPEKIKLIESAIEHRNSGRIMKGFAIDNDINYAQLSRWVNEYKSGLFGKTKAGKPGPKPKDKPSGKTPKIVKTVQDEFNRLTSRNGDIAENTDNSQDSRPVKVILYKTGEPYTKKITFKFDMPRFSDKDEFEHYVMCEILKNIRWQVVGFNGKRKY
jgi:hypothetical protein